MSFCLKCKLKQQVNVRCPCQQPLSFIHAMFVLLHPRTQLWLHAGACCDQTSIEDFKEHFWKIRGWTGLVFPMQHCSWITSDQWLLITLPTVQNPCFHIANAVEHRKFLSYHRIGVKYQFSFSLGLLLHPRCSQTLGEWSQCPCNGMVCVWSLLIDNRTKRASNHTCGRFETIRREETVQCHVPDLCVIWTILMEDKVVRIMDTVHKLQEICHYTWQGSWKQQTKHHPIQFWSQWHYPKVWGVGPLHILRHSVKKNGRNNNCLPASVAEVREQALKVVRCTPSASKSLQEGCTWGIGSRWSILFKTCTADPQFMNRFTIQCGLPTWQRWELWSECVTACLAKCTGNNQ